MTNWLKSINYIARKVGGIRQLILILLAAFLGVILLLDILVVEKIFDPLGYLYIVLGTLVVLYGIYPLYTSRRLVSYYWERARKNRGNHASGRLLILLLAWIFLPLPPATAVV